MAGELLASKIVVIEEDPRVRGLPSLPTAILAAIGFTERGPLNTAKKITSIAEFERIFGRLTSGKELPTALRMYFLNGGSQAVVVRAGGAGGVVALIAVLDNVPATTFTIAAESVGTWGNGLTANIAAATSGVAAEFNLEILQSGVVVEQFPNLIRTAGAARNVKTIVDAESNLVRITLGAGTARPVNATALALASGAQPAETAADITGNLAAFDIEQPTLLISPDSTVVGTHNAMITYCEVTRNLSIQALLDPPAGLNAAGIITHYGTISPTSEMAALYWPRIKIPNPSKRAFGATVADITIPPCGAIAGTIARNDGLTLEGPWHQPAGTEGGKLLGLIDVETTDVLKESVRDQVFPSRINPITQLSGYGIFVDGARVTKGDGNFPHLGARRGVSYVERTLKTGLQVFRHKNNTPELRAQVNRTITAFMMEQTRRGAFASRDPKKAFFVDTSDALNSASVVKQGKLEVRIGMATNTPAEFIVLRISQDTRAIEEELNART